VFAGETIMILDDRFNYGEERFVTFGLLEGHVVAIAHTEGELSDPHYFREEGDEE
jgi:uncharacterized DUF497 family protein